MANRRDELRCPRCGEQRSVAQTPLLAAEEEWRASGATDPRRSPGWSVEAARSGRLQWACTACIREGWAIEGHPAIQVWCDFVPYFAYFDVNLRCEDCHQPFVFAAAEQQFWYETLKSWVQSRPKQCIPCRRARRVRRQMDRGESSAG